MFGLLLIIGFIGFCVFLVGFVVILGGLPTTEAIIMTIAGGAAAGVSIGIFIKKIRDEQNEAEIRAINASIAKHYCSYNQRTGELKLFERGPLVGGGLTYGPIANSFMQHHDATIEYTGATIGNVTVGNIQVNPEHYTMSGGNLGKYQKYEILYLGNGEREQVRKIRLSPELLTEARKSTRILGWLHGDCINLVHGHSAAEQAVYNKALQEAEQTGRTDIAYNANVLMSLSEGLTSEQCKMLLSWISGKDV